MLCSAATTSPTAFPAQVATGLATLNGLCKASIGRGDYEEALRLCKRVRFDVGKLAPGSPEEIESLVNLGDIKALVQNYIDADAYYAVALQLAERAEGADSPQVAQLLATLVEMKVKRGKLLDAEALVKRLLVIRERTMDAADPGLAAIRVRYADLLAESRQFVEAEAEYGRAIGVLQDGGPGTLDAYTSAVLHLAESYERRALYLRAEMQYRRLLGTTNLSPEAATRIRKKLVQLASLSSQSTQ
ncbi:MAG: tetratricopeptide repeat protein [Gammaproteobacteria bacterium]